MNQYKFHYVYRITNVVENKHYYGTRSSYSLPSEDLGVKYFSSSRNAFFKKDQASNRNHYRYKIIRVFALRQAALTFEIQLHNKFNVGKNINFYNLAKQSSTGFSFDSTGIYPTVETRKKLSIAQQTRKPITVETRKKISDALTGKNNPRYGKPGTFKDKKHSPESLKKMSEFQQNRTTSDETRQKISNSLVGNTHRSGTKVSVETRKKISKAGKGRVFSEESKKLMSEKRKLYWQNKKQLP